MMYDLCIWIEPPPIDNYFRCNITIVKLQQEGTDVYKSYFIFHKIVNLRIMLVGIIGSSLMNFIIPV